VHVVLCVVLSGLLSQQQQEVTATLNQAGCQQGLAGGGLVTCSKHGSAPQHKQHTQIRLVNWSQSNCRGMCHFQWLHTDCSSA